MKKQILIAFILINLVGYSQNSLQNKVLPGFWGIEFGSSIDQVKSIMKAKNGCILVRGASDSMTLQLLYRGGNFAGNDIDFGWINFYKDRFYSSVFFLLPSSESRVISLYERLKKDLSNKYYQTEEYLEEYKYPYEKGDGHELTAIKLDKATFSSFWYFDNASIYLSITKDAKVGLSYSESKTEKIVDKLKESKNATDL